MSKLDLTNEYEERGNNLVLFEFVTTSSPKMKKRHKISSPCKTSATKKNHQTTPNRNNVRISLQDNEKRHSLTCSKDTSFKP